MGLRDLERAIERGVDGVLGRVFRSEVTQLEIAKRVERELDAGTRRGPNNTRVMANEIEVRIHPDDAAAIDPDIADIERGLLRMARDHARDIGCVFDGPLSVALTTTQSATKGSIEVFATSEHSIAGVPPGTLIYPDGYRFDLSATGVSGVILGRDTSSDIVIDDDRASREHAQLQPSPRGWILGDAGSTNGTRVNGFRASTQLLVDGDQITIGATTFQFEAS